MICSTCIKLKTSWNTKFNSLAPGRSGSNFKLVIYKLISRIDILSISCETALRWMPQDLIDD